MIIRKDFSLIYLVTFSLILHFIGCFFLYDFMNDEGGWLLNAKNMVLFNTWSLEGVYYTALSPLNSFLHFFLFELFSPSILIGRFVNIFFGVASLVLLYFFIKRSYDWKVATFAFFIITVNGVFNRISTIATLDIKGIFFCLLTLFFCFSSRQWIRRMSFIPFALALTIKPIFLYMAIPIVYALSLDHFDKTKLYPRFTKKTFLDISSFALGTFFLTGLFFYIAYYLNPEDYFFWSSPSLTASSRLSIFAMLKDPINQGVLSTVLYYIQRAPITSLCFFWGLCAVILEKKKTRVEIFLLLWVFAEFSFFVFQDYVPPRYMLNLIFPLSIFAGKAILNTVTIGKFKMRKYHLPQLILALIAFFQIGSSLYFFMILKPERPAIEVSQWLAENHSRYETILAPAQVIIEVPRKILAVEQMITIESLLSDKQVHYYVPSYSRNRTVEDPIYPVLCIYQDIGASAFKEDKIFLSNNGKLIKKIGYFSIYEIM